MVLDIEQDTVCVTKTCLATSVPLKREGSLLFICFGFFSVGERLLFSLKAIINDQIVIIQNEIRHSHC